MKSSILFIDFGCGFHLGSYLQFWGSITLYIEQLNIRMREMEAGVRLGSVQKEGYVSNPIPIERSLASTAQPILMDFIPKFVG